MPISNAQPSKLEGVAVKKILIAKVVSAIKIRRDDSFSSYTSFTSHVAKEVGVSVSLLLRKDGHYHALMKKLFSSLRSQSSMEQSEKQLAPKKELTPESIRIRELEHQLAARDAILNDINKQRRVTTTAVAPINFQYEFEKTCMLVSRILQEVVELEFSGSELMNLASFTGDPTLIANEDLTAVYLEWKNGKA
jgi:hypothetical protein